MLGTSHLSCGSCKGSRTLLGNELVQKAEIGESEGHSRSLGRELKASAWFLLDSGSMNDRLPGS